MEFMSATPIQPEQAVWANCSAVAQHDEVLSGTPVFRGTRVPISALFENLRDGASIDDFLAWFPGVTRSQVQELLAYEVARCSAGPAS